MNVRRLATFETPDVRRDRPPEGLAVCALPDGTERVFARAHGGVLDHVLLGWDVASGAERLRRVVPGWIDAVSPDGAWVVAHGFAPDDLRVEAPEGTSATTRLSFAGEAKGAAFVGDVLVAWGLADVHHSGGEFSGAWPVGNVVAAWEVGTWRPLGAWRRDRGPGLEARGLRGSTLLLVDAARYAVVDAVTGRLVAEGPATEAPTFPSVDDTLPTPLRRALHRAHPGRVAHARVVPGDRVLSCGTDGAVRLRAIEPEVSGSGGTRSRRGRRPTT